MRASRYGGDGYRPIVDYDFAEREIRGAPSKGLDGDYDRTVGALLDGRTPYFDVARAAILASRLLGKTVSGFTENVFHEEHLYYFTRHTLERALKETGFEVRRFFFQPSYLETHPTGPLVAVGVAGLRFLSWVTRRQTMLGAVGVRRSD